MKRISIFLVIIMLFSVVIAACQPAAEEAVPEEPAVEEPAPEKPVVEEPEVEEPVVAEPEVEEPEEEDTICSG